LNEHGLDCKVIKDGMQTMRAGVIPVRIEKLKIVPMRTFTPAEQEKFENEKARLAVEYGKMRQVAYKQEMKELKQKQKLEKREKK
jgi:hypothetical protein